MKIFVKSLLITSLLVGSVGPISLVGAVENNDPTNFTEKINYALDGTPSVYK